MKKVGTVILNKTPIGRLVYPVIGTVYGSNDNMGGSGFITWTCCAFQTKGEAEKLANDINIWHLNNHREMKSEMGICPLDEQLNDALDQYENIYGVEYKLGAPIEIR